jgi:toxin ParE1/3/4
MTRLLVTRSATADISKTLDYLQHAAGDRTADGYARSFQDVIIRLVNFPESGAPRPTLGEITRMIVIYPYVMLYDYDRSSDELTILRILHGKMSITAQLLRRS